MVFFLRRDQSAQTKMFRKHFRNPLDADELNSASYTLNHNYAKIWDADP